MLAWWVGGACAVIGEAPPTPEQPTGGGGVFVVPPDLRRALRAGIIREDDLLLALIASQFAKRLQ